MAETIERLAPGARSVLDVGCGNGEHLSHLASHFEHVAGIELSGAMVVEARRKHADVVVVEGDMRTARLGQHFDAVLCLNGSIAYMTDHEDLAAALTTMAAHLRPEGVALVEGWYSPSEWHAGRLSADATSGDGLGAGRLVATTSSRGGTLGHLHMAYLVLRGDRVEHAAEEHVTGLFEVDEYAAAFAGAGLTHQLERGIPGTGFRLHAGRSRGEG